MPSEPAPVAPAQRLHPSSLLFGVGGVARTVLVPLLIVWFGSSRTYEVWLLLLIVPVAAGSVIKYLNYRYRMGSDEMVIREGILTRNERHIPYARIQNIDLIQNPLHRFLKVAVVRIETASGGKPEAEIKVLALSAVDEMRSLVFKDRPAGGPAAEASELAGVAGGPQPHEEDAAPSVEARPLVQLPLRELVIFGVISNRGMVVVAAALGLMSQTGAFPDFDEWTPEHLERFRWIPSALDTSKPLGLVLVGLGALILLLTFMRVLSIVWAILKFYNFSLTQRGDDLRARYGLLTKVSATLPSHRIQLLSTNMSRLHRWFDRRSVQVETAGGGAGGGEPGSSRRQWLAPVIRGDAVSALIAEVLPGVDLEAVPWKPIEVRAWKRLFKRGLIWVIPVTVVAGLALRPWGPWGLLIALPALWLAYNHARRWVAATGYALLPGAILFKSGWWGQRMSVVRFSKIQALALRQTPFDRRHAMSTLSVDTAGAGRAGHRVDIPFLATETATGIAERLFVETGHTAFRW